MSFVSAVIEPQQFRQALGHFASGVTVITSQIAGTPIGFTCGSFYSVSMSPALVSFSVKKESASYPAMRQTGRFAINILSAGQIELSNLFAQRGADKWSGVEWSESPGGNPLIAGSVQWIDCEIYAEYEAGDHLIVLGEVKALSQTETQEPLIYFTGQYRQLASVTQGAEASTA